MNRGERDAADLVETMLRLGDQSPASSLQLLPYVRGPSLRNHTAHAYSLKPPTLSEVVRHAQLALLHTSVNGLTQAAIAVAGIGEGHEEVTPRTSQLGGTPSYGREWAAGDSARTSEGRGWPVDSLEHALELELDIQEADMRLVRHSIPSLGLAEFILDSLGNLLSERLEYYKPVSQSGQARV